MTFKDFLCKLGFAICWPVSIGRSENDSELDE